MSHHYKHVPDGSITSPKGFLAGTTYAGIKTKGEKPLDLGILCSKTPCVVAGTFTTNKVKAAPVVLCQERLAKGKGRAIVINSGCANACTGDKGMADAREMTRLTAKKLGILPEEVFVASTGVIGVHLPMKNIQAGIERIIPSPEEGHNLARAIMTTDTFVKEIALSVMIDGKEVIIAGIAKGAGMIHPDMATLLCFLTTDAALDAEFAQAALKNAVDDTFNMTTIDGDTSTNDTTLLLASGLAGNKTLKAGTKDADIFQNALNEVCLYLARCVAKDGEGATKLIEVNVEGALTRKDARTGARTIASSLLVKTAIYGKSANWGRILAALGRSGAEIDLAKTDVYIKDICLLKSGSPVPFESDKVKEVLNGAEIPIKVYLNLGKESAKALGCDLSKEYVAINSDYIT